MAVIPSQDQELRTMPNQFTLHICSETLSTNTFVLRNINKAESLDYCLWSIPLPHG